MFLSWSALAFLIFAAAVAWFWQDSLVTRERANAAAIDACERAGLQFLDGTVAFARIGWTRDNSGRLTLQRTYVFDYTANSIERLQGFVVLTGHRVDNVGYAAGDNSHQTRVAGSVPPSPPAGSAAILDLDRWRANHRQPIPPPREPREDRGDQSQ